MSQTKYLDQAINGRKYRLFLVPMGVTSPCGPMLAIFDVTSHDSAKNPVHQRLAMPHETETDLWEQAPSELEAFIRRQ
jgi:hypothetical protein